MKAILQHLRFPFSLLLMPVFWYSLTFISCEQFSIQNTWLLFIILHLLVYPASNAYNSTQDRDEGSVGLIKNPLPVPKNLFIVSVIIDVAAVLLSLLLHPLSAVLIVVYIIFSRLYSWRKVRLKRYPIIGFLTVFFCQGALIHLIVIAGCQTTFTDFPYQTGIHALIASLFIGSMYPLSQIYQHEQDAQDGVTTISAKFGYRNTFLFSGLQFVVASALMAYIMMSSGVWQQFVVYSAFQLPVILFFLYWFIIVMKDKSTADYKHTMYMNLISAVCMNACFIALLWMKA